MEIKRRTDASAQGRGSGPGKQNSKQAEKEPRKDVIIRMPESKARELKMLAALEDKTITAICLEAIEKYTKPMKDKHGI